MIAAAVSRSRGPFEPKQFHVGRARTMRGPGHRELMSSDVVFVVNDRSPDRLADDERLGLAARDRQRLALRFEPARPGGREIAVRVRAAFETDDVLEIAVAVGESPGDMAIAAGDDQRDAGQAHARYVEALRLDDEARAIPDIRHVEPEVHVVREQRAAAARTRARDGPVVAADHGLAPAHFERRLHPFFALAVEALEEPAIELAEVIFLCGRDRHLRQAAAVECGLIRGLRRDDEAVRRFGQHRREPVAAQFVAAGNEALEVDPHRMDHEDAVLRTPGFGRLAEQQVFEGSCLQRRRFPHSRRPRTPRAAPDYPGRARRAPPALFCLNWCNRMRRSMSSRPAPSRAASSPAPVRRSRSIWNRRSWAWAYPVARATSILDSPRITGTPAASRSIVTPAPRPASAASPSIAGRLARSVSQAAAIGEKEDHDG